MIEVAERTIAIYADIACPWSHVAVHRLHRTRSRLGLEEEVLFDLRPFPLEVFNSRATPKRTLDAEVPVAGGLEPGAGWKMWDGPEYDYPVSTLLALEAVQAAKAQGLEASAQLDRGLRTAFFAESRNVALRHVVLAVAEACELVDAGALRARLDRGSARAQVLDGATAPERGVKGSPHLFLPDGTDAHNPGIEHHWEGEAGGFPVVDKDDPSVYEDLLARAARA